MEYLALYRKYRPKELDEVVGQSEIKKILASSVKNGTITHAYLFSGPRGTGKTTMAKILAKMVNCLHPVDGHACGKCDSCVNILNSSDIIEIDAASNNGVDEIRDLREKANLVPSSAKYKVYIIDEVHMLTTQAFNALLKTLEEPPKHVIFVLATTEYYKIPLTITSRCQKFQFSKLTVDEIVDKLKEIAKLEKIKITDDALYEIAKISDGGMRDSINFLDQLRSFTSNKITIDDVYDVCGNVSMLQMVEVFNAIKDNNCENVTAFFENMNATGKNYSKFLEDFVGFLKDIILYRKKVTEKYINNNINNIQKVCDLFSIDDFFYMIENTNALLDKLKSVSRQSTVVITSFLLMMNKLNTDAEPIKIEKKEESYDAAFQFTSKDDKNDVVDSVKEKTTKVKSVNKVDKKEEKTVEIVNKNKEIIINNAFAVASKEIKNNLQEKLVKLHEYLTDKKYKVAAGSLIDAKLVVAGKEYLIFAVMNDAAVEKVYNNYKMCNELIKKVLGEVYNFVVLNQDEWCKYRDEYVVNFKNGKKYSLKELEIVDIKEKKVKNETTIVDKLFELVGEDNVEFK